MPKNKSGTSKKIPPSEMIRVPTALIGAVRQLSKLHRQGYTIALLQELEILISKFDSSSIDNVTPKNNVVTDSESIQQLSKKLYELDSCLADRDELIEAKLSTIASKLELLEVSIINSNRKGTARPRKQGYPYQFQQQQVELQPFPVENLAQRLGLTIKMLVENTEKLGIPDFISWTRNRDPRGIGWQFCEDDELYHPVKQ